MIPKVGGDERYAKVDVEGPSKRGIYELRKGNYVIMKIGIFKTSLKESERRVPIYPEHPPRFPDSLRSQMLFEKDHASDYGFVGVKISAKQTPQLWRIGKETI